MLNLRTVLLIVVAIGLQLPTWAQGGSTNSPYSRYAYGTLADRSISGAHAMGGLGYGLRTPNHINPLNPASYSAVDSLTFLFDAGVDLQFVQLKDASGKESHKNGNLKNLNMLFPLGKGFAFSAGILPVTYVGYEYGKPYTNSSLAQVNYVGSGGFQEVYGGLAYKHGNFSVGANIGYFFGEIKNISVTYPEGTSSGAMTDSLLIRSHNLTYTLGVQQMVPVNKDKILVLGLAYTPALKMGKQRHVRRINGAIETEITTPNDAFEMAQSIGFGASLVQSNKWTVGADVLWENWDKAKLNGVSGALNDRFRYAAGAEFIPDVRSRNFLNRMQYRAGAYYSNSYITTDAGVKFDEIGVSVGLGLPVSRSLINISFDYVTVNPSVANSLSERYFKIALSYTFNETWFRKWKLH